MDYLTTFCFNLNACQHHFYGRKKSEDKDAGPDLKVKSPQIQSLLKAPASNVKIFHSLEIIFVVPLSNGGPWNPLFPLYLALPGRLYSNFDAENPQ